MHKTHSIFIIVLVLLFSGCVHKESRLSESNFINDTCYCKEFYDCGIGMDIRVSDDFLIDGDNVYYGAFEWSDTGAMEEKICVGNLYSNELSKDTCLTLNRPNSVFMRTAQNSNMLYLLYADYNSGEIHVEKYDKNDSLDNFVNDIIIPCEKIHEEQIISFDICENGKIAILTSDNIYMYSENQEMFEYEKTDEFVFQKVFLKNNQVYCVCQESNSGDTEFSKIILYDNDGKIKKSLNIPVNSSAFTKIDDTLYFYVDDVGICVVDDELESFEILVDLSMEKKIWKEVFSILKHDGKYGILYQSLSDQAYRTVIFDNQKMHGKNKTEITIYDPSGYIESHCFEEIIDSFNETNPDYYVSIMESERELNYVLVSKKQPDLIILSDKTANLLGMEGYLEDLTSYLNEDNTGFRDELIDGLTEKISFDKKIFALPRCIELQTFCIRSSEVDNMPGWTTDDFFDWLIADPESLKDSWIGRLQLLRFCLEGTLEHYVDFDKNECHFNGEDFYRHMRKLKEVIVYPPKDIMPADAGKIRCISLGGFMNMLMKRDYNDPWIYKGFPTYDGKEKQIINYNALSILQASKNKEGAFEFIKYFVRYRYGDTNFFRTDIPVFQRVIQIAQREHRQIGENSSNYEAVGQEEIDMFWKLYNASEVNDISHLDIMDMVMEEAVQYTTDKKELEEVADIIQKRVQLLLNERK